MKQTLMKQTLSAVAMLAMTMSMGCGKKDEAKDSEDKPAATAPATDKAPADDKATADKAAPAGDSPLVCCEFNGAIGTATQEKCIEFKGKIVEGLAPPCTK